MFISCARSLISLGVNVTPTAPTPRVYTPPTRVPLPFPAPNPAPSGSLGWYNVFLESTQCPSPYALSGTFGVKFYSPVEGVSTPPPSIRLPPFHVLKKTKVVTETLSRFSFFSFRVSALDQLLGCEELPSLVRNKYKRKVVVRVEVRGSAPGPSRPTGLPRVRLPQPGSTSFVSVSWSYPSVTRAPPLKDIYDPILPITVFF